MPIQFTPQFFTRPTIATSKPIANTVNDVDRKTKQESESEPEQRKYSLEHPKPKHDNIFGSPTALLSSNGERYADIDWTHHKVITQDGRHVRFGAPQFDAGEDVKGTRDSR